jgi:hypothetical protein
MKVAFFNNNEFKGTPANISVNKTESITTVLAELSLLPMWEEKIHRRLFPAFSKVLTLAM